MTLDNILEEINKAKTIVIVTHETLTVMQLEVVLLYIMLLNPMGRIQML